MSDITLGIIGGGQLGSMMAIAAKKLILNCNFCDDVDAPAQNFCNNFILEIMMISKNCRIYKTCKHSYF